jgi:hypothetical protein
MEKVRFGVDFLVVCANLGDWGSTWRENAGSERQGRREGREQTSQVGPE